MCDLMVVLIFIYGFFLGFFWMLGILVFSYYIIYDLIFVCVFV